MEILGISLLVLSIIALVMFFILWIISDGNVWFAVAVIAIMAHLVTVAFTFWWRGYSLT